MPRPEKDNSLGPVRVAKPRPFVQTTPTTATTAKAAAPRRAAAAVGQRANGVKGIVE